MSNKLITDNKKYNMTKLNKKQRKEEIIKNLTNTITKEQEKHGGGNKELIGKFEQILKGLK